MLRNLSRVLTGASISAFGIAYMDDVVYNIFRENVFSPFINLIHKKQNLLDLGMDDLSHASAEVRQGSSLAMAELRPGALQRTNLKELFIDDKDYSSPSDHYFSAIQRRTDEDDYLRDIDVEEMRLENLRHIHFPQHTEKEYRSIQNISVGELLKKTESTKLPKEFVEFDDDDSTYDNLVVIEPKHKPKKKSVKKNKKKRRSEDSMSIEKRMNLIEQEFGDMKPEISEANLKEIEKLSKKGSEVTPQELAQQFEKLPLKVREVSKREKKRLRRLKNKAMQHEEDKNDYELEQTPNNLQEVEIKEPLITYNEPMITPKEPEEATTKEKVKSEEPNINLWESKEDPAEKNQNEQEQ